MSIEAMKQMVDALEYHQQQTRPITQTQEAIAAGRAAIAEAEKQEPVLWAHWESSGYNEEPTRLVLSYSAPDEHQKRIANWFPLYTHPQADHIAHYPAALRDLSCCRSAKGALMHDEEKLHLARARFARGFITEVEPKA